MIYIDGVGYVDERSYNAFQKTKNPQSGIFDKILQQETIIYATPEDNGITSDISAKTVTAPSQLEQYFQDAAKEYNLGVNLLKAVAKQESDFNPNCTSSAGAMGIMQLMPSTASSLGVSNAYDPQQNIMGGAKYLSQLMDRFQQDISLVLAAYNAGPGNVEKYNGIPPFKETQAYVQNVLGYMGQDLSITNTVYASPQNENETVAGTIYAIASKDVTTPPKIYIVDSKPAEA